MHPSPQRSRATRLQLPAPHRGSRIKPRIRTQRDDTKFTPGDSDDTKFTRTFQPVQPAQRAGRAENQARTCPLLMIPPMNCAVLPGRAVSPYHPMKCVLNSESRAREAAESSVARTYALL
jgi:hypothetical protein